MAPARVWHQALVLSTAKFRHLIPHEMESVCHHKKI